MMLGKKPLIMINYFKNIASKFNSIKKVKGRGLMLGLEFAYNVSELRCFVVVVLIHLPSECAHIYVYHY